MLVLHAPAKHHANPALEHAQQALRECSDTNTRACVEYVVWKVKAPPGLAAWLRAIPGCESTWSPWAYSPGLIATSAAQRAAVWRTGVASMGLFQFEKGTWLHTPFAGRPIWSPLWNAMAAAWLYRQDGGGREWSCTARLGLA